MEKSNCMHINTKPYWRVNTMNKRVKIVIGKAGEFTFEALEGFQGASCVEQTKEIELLLGGVKVDDGKKPEFYQPDLNTMLDNNI